MTKAEVIALCVEVQNRPFCQLSGTDGYSATLTRHEYDREMMRDRPWTMPDGGDAWYDDEESEALQEAWYIAIRMARYAVAEWEAAHKGSVPQWATRFWS